MKVTPGRRGGHTTQMFIEALADNRDVLIRCRQTLQTQRDFIDIFGKLIIGIGRNRVKLVDGRTIRFIHMSDIQSITGINDKLVMIKTDI